MPLEQNRSPQSAGGGRVPTSQRRLQGVVVARARVEEIIFRFFDDIGGVDEKEEVAVAFLIEIKDQACHDERFTAAGRHVEQKVERSPFTGEIVFKTEEKPRERLFLIGTEFKRGVEVIGEIRWNFGV